MSDSPPKVSAEELAALPASVLALILWQQDQILKLSERIAELEAQLGKDSTNSSKPPSTAHPHAKPPPKKSKSKKSQGGQKGHQQHLRPLLPTEECAEVIDCIPTSCRRCGKELQGTDPQPLRHQVWELPEIRPLVTEFQRHRLKCSCGCSTCATLPDGTPSGQAGPRLIAFSALLMACFRQSKRRAALFLEMILGQPASAAWMIQLQDRAAEAIEPAYQELAEQLPVQEMLFVDESPTKEGKSKAWLWSFVASTFTFFAVRLSRAAEVAKELLHEDYSGVVHCDRAKMYWCFERLQWCWAHLKRDFQGLIDSGCNVKKRLGHDLMRETKKLFALWAKVRDGTLSREQFRKESQPIRREIESYLLRGTFTRQTKGFCKELYKYRDRLWTFVEVDGVEPTNNAAEQSLRHAVIWRKLSFGTQSPSGSRFVARMFTVIETCRRQTRDVFAWMTEAVEKHFYQREPASLLSGS